MEIEDYSYQVAAAASQNIKERDYWLEKLANPPSKTSIDYDFKKIKPAGKDIEITRDFVEFAWDNDLYARLTALSSGSDYTLHIILAAGLTLLLHKYTGSRDILIGSPIYKQKKESQFINTVLVFRNRIEPQHSFKDLLLQVKQTVIEAAENQNYPFNVMLKQLNLPTPTPAASPKENPLFDIALILENLQDKTYIQDTDYNILFFFSRTPDHIKGRVEYNPCLYQQETIKRIVLYFTRLMEKCPIDVKKQLNDMDILNEKEKKKLLTDFCNWTPTRDRQEPTYPAGKCVMELFTDQVTRTPDHIAVTAPAGKWQHKRVKDNIHITYRQLNQQAHQLASLLKENGVKPDTIVGVMLLPSIDMIITLWGILKADGAYLPIAPEYPPQRINYMLQDSGTKILLAAPETQDKAKEVKVKVKLEVKVEESFIDIIDISNLSSSLTLTLTSTLSKIAPANLAYIIYTSGSTGQPKGVPVQHSNLMNYLLTFCSKFVMNPTDTVIHLSDYTFDAFVEELYPVLLKGGKIAIPGEDEYLDIHNLGYFILNHKVSFIDCSPLLLNQLNKLDPLYLKGVHTFISGGDVLRSSYVDQLLKIGKVYNTYGPTESTVCATYYRYKNDKVMLTSIPIGKPIANYQVYIKDENLRLLPIGITGEICVSGPGVTRGYLNRPELTAEKFDHDLKDYPDYHDRRYHSSNRTYMSYIIYHTGDLGRWLPDGNIQYVGRKDIQVKIRGFRIETGEIETLLLKRKEIKEAAVIAREKKDGEKYLCAYYVPGDDTIKTQEKQQKEQVSKLKEYLIEKLPDFMIPSFFIKLGKLPLTLSGKVDRKALPEPKIKASVEYVPPGNEIEKHLHKIWMDIFAIDRIGIDDNFFEIGGNSLSATAVISNIHQAFNLKLPLSEIFRSPTIRQLTLYIRDNTPGELTAPGSIKLPDDQYAAIEVVEKKRYYPLSSAQKRLDFLQQLDINSTSYNITLILPLSKDTEIGKLKSTFMKLIARHESLRTSFITLSEEPVQKIHEPDEVKFKMEYYNIATGVIKEGRVEEKEEPFDPKSMDLRAKSYIKIFVRSFDLSQAPLLRVWILKTGEANDLLLVDMHHIISDATSMEILRKEFYLLYENRALPALRLQYRDFSGWQNHLLQSGLVKKQETFWLNAFGGELPVLTLPYDYPRPRLQSFEGSSVDFVLNSQAAPQLKSIAKEAAATLYMIILSIFTILLSKLSSQEDIIVGTPLAGRRHADLENIIGMFVNTLPTRHIPAGEKTFTHFLKEVKEHMLEVFENQDYQFEELVEKVAVQRDTSRNPIFDVTFNLLNQPNNRDYNHNREVNDENEYIFEHKPGTAKFDLNLTALESGDDTGTGKTLFFTLEYSTRLFKADTIDRFIGYFKKIVSVVLACPTILISGIEILSEEEKQQLLVEFNDTTTVYPKDKTIHELFELQEEQTPYHVALVEFHETHEKHEKNYNMSYMTHMSHISYQELKQKSHQLAQQLKEKGVKPDTIVAIMVERSIEMIICLLGILKAGGAYLPIETDYPEDRINYMLADSNSGVLVTTPDLPRKIAFAKEIVHLADAINRIPSPHLHLSPAPVTSLAYIVYTSGSTGKPKGVMVTQQNVIRLVKNTNYLCFSENQSILQTGSLSFDASTFEIWGALLNSLKLYLAPKKDILNPYWLKTALIKWNITTIWMTSPLFNHMSQEDIEIFSTLKYLLAGGDLLSPVHINRLRQRYPGVTIINGYGPTENTTFSTTFRIERDYPGNIPIGRPISNSTAYILDRYGYLVPIGVTGELLVGGDGVSRGYLNNPELTAEKFDYYRYHRSYRSNKSYTPYLFYYKTGDLARWLADGNIEFLGRIDFQVKIRGFRVELGEIENQLLKYQAIKEAVVIERETREDKYLCAYIAANDTADISIESLRKFLSQFLPDYMIPAYFIPVKKIPLTPNGKVDRKALPEPGPEPEKEYTPPRNKIEEKLVSIWREILGDCLHTAVGIDDNFFELGGHSLKATILASRIHKELDVQVSLTEIFVYQTIRELCQYIEGAVKDKFTAVEPVEKREYYALSSAQKRLYILQQMELTAVSYNIPDMIPLPGKPDVEKLKQTFKRLILRHESLRTSFILVDEEPMQRIHDKVQFEIEYFDMKGAEVEVKVKVEEEGVPGGQVFNAFGGQYPRSQELKAKSFIHSFIRPFDLSQAPLLRVGLIQLPHTPPALRVQPSQEGKENEYILMMDMHHIISDATSIDISRKEFNLLYEDKADSLPLLKLQYKDFSRWQNHLLQSGGIREQEAYWLMTFGSDVPVLTLPYDYPRPSIQSFQGSQVSFVLAEHQGNHLIRTAKAANVTLYMFILSMFTILLSKLSGQEDIIVGTPLAGRRHADLENIIGMFVNTLPTHHIPAGEKIFTHFLKEVKAQMLEVYENQDYQFEELVEKAAVQRDTGRNPIFDVTFNLLNLPNNRDDNRELNDENEHILEHRQGTAKFDLNLTALESGDDTGTGNGLYFTLEYSTRLFKAHTINRFIDYFKKIASVVLECPTMPLSGIEILGEKEKQQMLIEFNDTAADYPKDKTLNELFAMQAEQTPDYIAVVGPRELHHNGTRGLVLLSNITYKELNDKSHRLSRLLRQKGVTPDTLVGIMVERSIELIIGILGILKAGSAYLPIDPHYPPEHINYILKDSQCRVVLTESILEHQGPDQVSTIYRHPGKAAYVIYTSGTTGKPKGCIVTHRNLVRLFKNHCLPFYFDKTDTWIMAHSFCFDFSVWEMYGALLYGGRLIVPLLGQVRDIDLFLLLIKKHQVTILNQTPQAFYALVQTEKRSRQQQLNQHLRYIIFGGDKLLPRNLTDWIDIYPGQDIQLINMYGITETTIHVTYYRLTRSDIRSPRNTSTIGTPLPETTLYILDNYLNPVPIGIIGEIFVGGSGVAPGYLNRVELTVQRFFENPHIPGKILYKSGDLGRRLADGNVEYLGRNDDQVQIRGFRIEPAEIESHLLNHPTVKEIVVLAREDQNLQTSLCAYIRLVPGQTLPPISRMREYLAERLPNYMIPSYFVPVNTIPLTPNGKVDKKALPDPQVTREKPDRVLPRTPLEESLAETWAEVLEMKKEDISMDDDFFDSGGHSLKATVLIARIHQKFNVKIPLMILFQAPQIRKLAEYITDQEQENYYAIEPAEKKEYYPLSPTQKRLFVLHQLVPNSTGYNVTFTILLEAPVDKEKLETIFNRLISRHESLRTSFLMIGQEPLQMIHKEVEFKIEYDQSLVNGHWSLVNCQTRGEVSSPVKIETITREFIRPFDLSCAPLLRVGLIKLAHTPSTPGGRSYQGGKKGKYLLIMDMHHIITDAASLKILTGEFGELDKHPGKEPGPLRLQYKDFSEWVKDVRQKTLIKQQEYYWLKEFPDELPVLNLPTDYPRPLMQDFEGNVVYFAFNPRETKIIKKITRDNDITLFMCLLTVFNILFSKLSGQEDIIMGTPIAARRHADLQYIIGMLVNTLPLRNYPSANKTFLEFLQEVKQRTLDAYENQEYPFEELVDHLLVNRDTSRNPVFDVMVNLMNQHDYTGNVNFHELHELTTSYQHSPATSRFDMLFSVIDLEEYFYFMVEYSTRLFTPTTINRFIDYLKHIVRHLPGNTENKLTYITMIGDEEKQALLEFCTGNEDIDHTRQTIHRWFEDQVEKTPDNIAVNGPGPQHITYGKLNRSAYELMGLLQEKAVRPDSVVGLMMERSIEMIVGIIAILKAGAGYLPIDPDYPEERIKYMLADSNADVLLTGTGLFKQDQKIKKIKKGEEKIVFPNPVGNYKNLLYVIYTSGSTGKPKGVMLEHGNLVNLIRFQYNATPIDFSRVLQFTTISFDVSAQEIFSTLLQGGQLSLVSKDTLADVLVLLRVVEKNQIKTLFLPASFLKFLMAEEDFLQSIPDSVAHIVTAGEQVIVNQAFKRYLKEHRVYFHNHYGPSETHVVTTLSAAPGEHVKELPPIGRPVSNTLIYILDKGYHLTPVGIPGEIFIGGLQVGRGYLNNPELTANKFLPVSNIFYMFYISYLSYILYKTEDLARWLPGGDIEFLGRSDYQVKIRGFRVELGEIESRLLNHPAIKEALVQARAFAGGERYLCAYIAVKRDNETAISTLREYLSKHLPEYMIPAYFVLLDELPLTPNRKIDRRCLPEPDLQAAAATIAPGNELQIKLAGIWAEVLGINRDSIGIDSNFFELGGHSLKATMLVSWIHKELDVRVPLPAIFTHQTIRGLHQYIKERVKDKFTPVKPGEKREYYALSSAQKRLYILRQMELTGTAYNLPQVIPLPGDADIKKLQNAFKQLIQRHESLRTSFVFVNEEPIQRIHDEVQFEIEYFDMKGTGVEVKAKVKAEEEQSLRLEGTRGLAPLTPGSTPESSQFGADIIHSFIRPFDLSQAPLLRVGIIALPHTPSALRVHPSQEGNENAYILIVDMHHIISDGVSLQVLQEEFTALSHGEELPPLRIQYKDFAQWQNSGKEKENIKQQESYWLKEFAGEIPVLDTATDYPRPMIQRFEGNRVILDMSPGESRSLQQFARAQGVTLYMLLLAVTDILLFKLSNQEDIIIGSPIAGRRHVDLEKIIGMFVNTLALRNFPHGEKTCKEFLAEVKKRTLQAFENQEYQFEDLVEKLEVKRDAGRNPLFDIMFAVQNLEDAEITPGQQIPALADTYISSKFDMTVTAVISGQNITVNFTYNTSLFKQETIQAFSRYFKKIISFFSGPGDIKLFQLETLSEEEKHHLLYDLNQTASIPIEEKNLKQLFTGQLARTPDYVALVGPKLQITYRELNERSDCLARLLMQKGCCSGGIAAVIMEPQPEMITGIIAILKAGASYLPIDPLNPPERINYMLADSQAGVLLTTSKLEVKVKAEVKEGSRLPQGLTLQVINIDRDIFYLPGSTPSPSTSTTTDPGTGTEPAYIIYTSGTTGKPKGVQLTNKNLVNYVTWFSNETRLTTGDRTVLTSSFAFDLGYTSIYPSLLQGAQLHMIPRETYMSPGHLLNYISLHRISYLKMTPSLFSTLVEDSHFSTDTCRFLRLVVLGGEAIDVTDVEKAYRICRHLEIMNHYGPTEVTIGCIAQFIEPGNLDTYKLQPTIGRPIYNTRVFILDRYLNLLPVGTAGELCLSGAGLAAGYLNRPELTAEKFIGLELNLEPGIYHRSHLSYTSYILYKTGDLARWLSSSKIEFTGRIDQQIKIRGYRIEMGEIQARLLNHEKIKEAAVIAAADETGQKYLCAYYVPDKKGQKEKETAAGLRTFLSRQLPDYMVPAYYIDLEKLPLTPNGKLDQKALPPPRIKVATPYAAPRNLIEVQLLKIWSEVLGLGKDALHDSRIGINDNFFELGGHSLKATTLVSRIRQELQTAVPLVEIFRYPTIRLLAIYIQQEILGNLTVDDNDLILLKPGRSCDRHLFFIHDGSGGVEGYIEFCEALSTVINYWGIRAELLGQPGPQNCTIEGLAGQYIEKIKKIQAHGPYRIAGWSLGGTIAFEIARQLEHAGESVSFLGLMDSPGPPADKTKETRDFNVESELAWLWEYLPGNQIKEKLKNTKDINETWTMIVNYFEENHLKIEMVRQLVDKDLARIIPHYDQLGLRELVGHFNTNRTLTRARSCYIPPGKVQTTLHFFTASESPGIFQDSWNDYCNEPIKSYKLPGDHFSIFKPPHVGSSTKIIENAILNNSITK